MNKLPLIVLLLSNACLAEIDRCPPSKPEEIDHKILEAKLPIQPETQKYFAGLAEEICFFNDHKKKILKNCYTTALENCVNEPVLDRIKSKGISATGWMLFQTNQVAILTKLEKEKKIPLQEAQLFNFVELKFVIEQYQNLLEFKVKEPALKRKSCQLLLGYSQGIQKMLVTFQKKDPKQDWNSLLKTQDSNIKTIHQFCD